MKEKILSELKKKYSGQATAKLLETIAERLVSKVAEEKDIEGVVNELENGAITFKDVQGEGDRRAADYIETNKKLQAELEAAKKPVEKKEEQKPDDEVTKKLDEMLAKIENLEKEKQSKSKKEAIAAKLKEKGIPDFYLDGLNIDSVTEEDAVNSCEKLHEKAKEEYGNKDNNSRPLVPDKSPKTIEADIKRLADKF